MTKTIDFELKERYDFACAKCGHEMQFAPCIFMQMGINSGSGKCTSCGAFLKLYIDDDKETGRSMPWDQFLKEIKNEQTSNA